MKRIVLIMFVLGLSFSAQIAQAQWTPVKRLTWNRGESAYPAIVVDSIDNLHVVWNDDDPGNYEIYYKRSTDGGATWLAGKRLTWNRNPSLVPAIAVDPADNLHVVWEEYLSGNAEIYYRKSTDG